MYEWNSLIQAIYFIHHFHEYAIRASLSFIPFIAIAIKKNVLISVVNVRMYLYFNVFLFF